MASDVPPAPLKPAFDDGTDVDDLLPYARRIVDRDTETTSLTTGYGMVGEGDRVAIARSSLHDDRVVEALVAAFREKGVDVDVYTADMGPDRERAETLDFDWRIGSTEASRRIYERHLGRFREAEPLAADRGHDLLIAQTAGAPPTGTPFEVERIPWQTPETFASDAAFFPEELLLRIASALTDQIWTHGPGSEVRITDPKGTDLTFTFPTPPAANSPEGTGLSEAVWREHYAESSIYDGERRTPPFVDNHVIGKPWPPLFDGEDASGVIASTHGHHGRPYPRIELEVTDGVVTAIDGGGELGDRLRDLRARTADISYPDYPGEGLLWVWEYAIGTNPKVFRPPGYAMTSGPGGITERMRSGIMHLGVGTWSQAYSEDWAIERGHPFGHVDFHLNFPTYEIHTGEETVTVIEDGRLTVLDDPEIRDVASKHGDPDELLRECWVPKLPGFNADGTDEDYAGRPFEYQREAGYIE